MPMMTSRPDPARTRRWAMAWLFAGAVLAVLLLANSIRDYLFVSQLLAVQQVRRQLGQQVAALEQKLRRGATGGVMLYGIGAMEIPLEAAYEAAGLQMPKG
jgi:hypothetical protein